MAIKGLPGEDPARGSVQKMDRLPRAVSYAISDTHHKPINQAHITGSARSVHA